MNFDQAFKLLIGHEGGYVNDPQDPGGETKFGISKRSYPALDIANLTLEQAKEIYLRDYWAPASAAPDVIKFDLFDMAVNSGVETAVRMLQRAVGTGEDGVLGPITLQAANSMNPMRLALRFNAARLRFYTSLAIWPRFGKGWARRIAGNLDLL